MIIIACTDPAEAADYMETAALLARVAPPAGFNGEPLRGPVATDWVIATEPGHVPASASGAVFLGEVGPDLAERVAAALDSGQLGAQ